MDLAEKYFRKYTVLQKPGSEDEFLELEGRMSFTFPKDFKEFLLKRNGIEGFVGESYLRIYAINQIEDYTTSYCSECFPDKICIGTNGNLELLVINRGNNNQQYGIIPSIGDADDYINLGSTLENFFKQFYSGTVFKS